MIGRLNPHPCPRPGIEIDILVEKITKGNLTARNLSVQPVWIRIHNRRYYSTLKNIVKDHLKRIEPVQFW